MKSSSLLPLIGTSIALCAASAYATGVSNDPSSDKVSNPGKCVDPPPCEEPKPGNSHKCTRVDFDHPNNGWGNGDQDPPGNSGDHNNAENGPGDRPPGNPGDKDTPVDCDTTNGNNGWGNGDQNPPGNSGDRNNAENGPSTSSPGTSGNNVVARREK